MFVNIITVYIRVPFNSIKYSDQFTWSATYLIIRNGLSYFGDVLSIGDLSHFNYS